MSKRDERIATREALRNTKPDYNNRDREALIRKAWQQQIERHSK